MLIIYGLLFRFFLNLNSLKRSFSGFTILGNLSNDNGGDNKNGKKAITLHVHDAFLYSSLPSLHDYNMKRSIFTFCRDTNTGHSFSFPERQYSPVKFNFTKKIFHCFSNSPRLKKCDKV